MQKDIREWSIVIAGGWNTRIFTPPWVQRNVFNTDQVRVEFSLMPGLAPRYTQSDITLVPESERLLLRPLRTDDDVLQLLEDKAWYVLDTLPHTPISGVGINFGYVEPNPDESLLRYFTLADNQVLSTAEYAVEETTIWRKLRFGGQQLNLGMTCKSDHSVAVKFNFHTDAQDTEQAKAAIRDRIIPLKTRAVEFLSTVYGVSIQEAQE